MLAHSSRLHKGSLGTSYAPRDRLLTGHATVSSSDGSRAHDDALSGCRSVSQQVPLQMHSFLDSCSATALHPTPLVSPCI